MKGYKDTTKTHFVSGPKACGHSVRGAAKVASAMKTFKGQETPPRKPAER